MIRVPFNRTLDATEAAKLRSEFERYAEQVIKDPSYGQRRKIREEKRRLYHEKRRKQRNSKEAENVTPLGKGLWET